MLYGKLRRTKHVCSHIILTIMRTATATEEKAIQAVVRSLQRLGDETTVY